MVFWSDSWMSSVQHTVIQWYFPSFDGRNNVHRKKRPWKQEFFAQLVATMMYYEDTSRLTWTQHFIKC